MGEEAQIKRKKIGRISRLGVLKRSKWHKTLSRFSWSPLGLCKVISYSLLMAPSQSTFAEHSCPHAWFAPNTSFGFYTSAEAACNNTEVASSGYPGFTPAGAEVITDFSARCFHVNSDGARINILNASKMCLQNFIATTNKVNDGNGQNNTCNPVNISTGNKYFREVDYSGNGSSPLEVVRSYNSFTEGWSFSYRQSLLRATSYSQKAFRPDGKTIEFTYLKAPAQRTEKLSLLNGIYELTLSNNQVERYDSNGNLLSIQAISGDLTQLEYTEGMVTVISGTESLKLHLNTAGQVVKAVLPDNSEISYYHNTANNLNRLEQVVFSDSTPANATDNPKRTCFYEDAHYPRPQHNSSISG